MANCIDKENIIKTYKDIYTTWCRKGMYPGIMYWVQGRGGQGYKNGYVGSCQKPFDIYWQCEHGRYIDEYKPWINYDKNTGNIGIYCVYRRKYVDLLLGSMYVRTAPFDSIISYAHNHALKAVVIPGNLGAKQNVDVLEISGKQSDFIEAGWQIVYDQWLEQEQSQKRLAREKYSEGCKEARQKIIDTMPLIERAYFSEAMKNIESYTPAKGYCSSGVLGTSGWTYTLYAEGVKWHMMTSSGAWIESSWFMSFSKIGYESLNTDEQLFAFAVAMFCAQNGIVPRKINVEKIEWNCEIVKDHTGKRINNPRFIPETTQPVELKQIF